LVQAKSTALRKQLVDHVPADTQYGSLAWCKHRAPVCQLVPVPGQVVEKNSRVLVGVIAPFGG